MSIVWARSRRIMMTVIIVIMGASPYCIFAQKTERQMKDEYRKNIRVYIQDLDDNFARRYLYQEQYLIDLIESVRQELAERKSKGVLTKSPALASNSELLARRDSLHVQISEITKLLREMKRRNALLPDYDSRASIQVLHQRYEKLYAEDFELARIDAQAVRQALIGDGQTADVRNLFQRELETALRRYKEEDFATATMELSDLYETFQKYFTEWDDILYYVGDGCFRLHDFGNAETYFAKVTSGFSASPYADRAYTKLIAIAYIDNNRTKMLKYFGDFDAKMGAASGDKRYNRAAFMAATTYFRNSDFTSAISTLEKIGTSSAYYYPARYLMGHCYANQESYSAAIDAFNVVVKGQYKIKGYSYALQEKLRDLALLKTAFIQFEQNFNGQKFRNVYPILAQIPPGSEVHDVALLAAAWSAFKDNSVDTARIFADSLIRNYPASEFIFEGKTLLGNIEVLDPKLSDKDRELLAVDAYDYVARAMEAKYLADQFILERDSVVVTLDRLAEARTSAGLRKDSLAYMRYDGIHQILEVSLLNNGFAKAVKGDSRSMKFYQNISDLISDIRVTEGKIQAAEEAGDQALVDKLTKDVDKMLARLESLGGEQYIAIIIPGFAGGSSDDLESVLAMRNDAVTGLKQKVENEKRQLDQRVQETDRLIQRATQKNNAKEVARLQDEKTKLTNSYTQVEEYERWVNGLEAVDEAMVRELTGGTSLGTEFGRVSFDNYSNLAIQNYFSLHKISRVISEIDARNRSVTVLHDKITREKDLIVRQLDKVDQLMKEAKARNRSAAVIKLEFEKNRLADLYARVSDYEVRLSAQENVESYADLDVWGDFASYGRNNITYVINTTKIETINDLARAIGQIDKILVNRKKNYEYKIAQIEEEIKRKDQEIRDKELQELRSSQKQYYEKEFFLFKSTEKPQEDPFDYKGLVPEVIDTKAIEDSLKKLEIQTPVVPTEGEETGTDTSTFQMAPVDTATTQPAVVDTSGSGAGLGVPSGKDTTASGETVKAPTGGEDASGVKLEDTTSTVPAGEDTGAKPLEDTTSTAPADTTGDKKSPDESGETGGQKDIGWLDDGSAWRTRQALLFRCRPAQRGPAYSGRTTYGSV